MRVGISEGDNDNDGESEGEVDETDKRRGAAS